MAQAGKREPVEQPEPGRPLRETLEQGLKDSDVARRLSVELRVSGGMPEKAYHFHLRVAGGRVESQIRDAATGRRAENKGATMAAAEWSALLRAIRTSRVLDVPEEPPRFLPDTLVGHLEITDGESTHVLYFAADEDQARAQNKVPPAQVRRAVNAIYRLASQLLNVPSAKP
jgi:hypothetical protein